MANYNPKTDHLHKTAWKPGASGNKAGKPKGTLNLSTHIRNLLNDESFVAWVPDSKFGIREFKGAPIKAIINSLIIRAIAGDVRAFDLLAKYGYGSKIDLSVEPSYKPALVEFVGENTA